MTIPDTSEGGAGDGFLENQGGLDHPTLVADMKRNDKQPIEQRVLNAKQNREVQLKVYETWLREHGGGEGDKETNTLRFPQEVHLMDAAVKGAVEDMKDLLQGGMDPNTSNQDGLTALHQCCIDGQEEMVELLLSHKASVNATDRDGWTPLHAAATCGHYSIARRLVEEGADLLAVNGDGDMPFDITEDEQTLQFIEEAMTDKGISHDMVTKKREELHDTIEEDVQGLIEQGHSLDIPVNADGATLLHVAIVNEYNDIVRLLLDNGASDENEDVEGWRPLHAAAFWGNKEAVELLIEKRDTDLRAVTDSGMMPFDMSDDSDIRKILLNAISKNPGRYSLAMATGDDGKRKDSSSSDDSSRGSADGVEDSNSGKLKFVAGKSSSGGQDTSAEMEQENAQSSSSSDSEKREDEKVEEMVLPTLKRVESVSNERNSMREAKKQAPMIRYSQINKLDAPEAYDDSYELMLTKPKKGVPKKQPEAIAEVETTKPGTSVPAEDPYMKATHEEEPYLYTNAANESLYQLLSPPPAERKSSSSSSSSSSSDDLSEVENEPPRAVASNPPSYLDVPLKDASNDIYGEKPSQARGNFLPPLDLNRGEMQDDQRRLSSTSSSSPSSPTPAPRTVFANISYIQPNQGAPSTKPSTTVKQQPPAQQSVVSAPPPSYQVSAQNETAMTAVTGRRHSVSSEDQPSLPIRPVEVEVVRAVDDRPPPPSYESSVNSRRSSSTSSSSSSSSSSLSPSYDFPMEATKQKSRDGKSAALESTSKPLSSAITVYPREAPSSSTGITSTNTNPEGVLQPRKEKQRVPQSVEQPPRVEAQPKRFAVLRDNVRQPTVTGAKPKKGTLQDLKLKRQKSRMSQLGLEEGDASTEYLIGGATAGGYGTITGHGSTSDGRREVFRAPDSPTRIRHVFKQPEVIPEEKTIFTRERCTIV